MRLLTLVGFVAHALDRSLAYLFWFVPFRVPWSLVLVALLGWGAWQSAASARAVEEARPSPSRSSVAEIVRGGNPAWVLIDAILSGPHYDNSSYAPEDEVRRYYYVLRDPDEPELAVVVRSERTADQLRRRTIVARLEDGRLVELAPEEAAAPDASPVPVTPSEVARTDAELVRLTGSFGAAQAADGAYDYRVTDGVATVIVRSPHPPNALPVEITGIVATDRFRMRQVLDGTPLAGALAGSRHPDVRLLIEGAAPLMVEVTYVPAIVMGVTAATLLMSALIGYPIYRRRTQRRLRRVAPLTRGEELPVEVSGRLPTPHGLVRLEGESGSLSRMPASEAVRKEWQYWGQPLTNLAPVLREAMQRTDDEGRLMLHAAGGSALLSLDPRPGDLRLDTGRLETILSGRPAIRLRTGEANAILAFATEAQRDRAWIELEPTAQRMAAGEAPHEATPQRREARPPASPAAERQLRASAIFFALVGLLVAGLGVAGLPAFGVVADPVAATASALFLVVIGSALVALARGLRARRDWARVIGLNVAAAGTLVALVIGAGEATCLRPLGPTLQPCDAGSAAGVVGGLLVATGFGLSFWTLHRSRTAFSR